jgi:hypothetical protein
VERGANALAAAQGKGSAELRRQAGRWKIMGIWMYMIHDTVNYNNIFMIYIYVYIYIYTYVR